jgi:hypothetical protein
MILPPPHVRGERRCAQCSGEQPQRHRIYMHFMVRKDWYCQFLEADLKTPLARKVTIRDEKKLFEMAERGGFKMTPAARQKVRRDIQNGRGGIWLELTVEQYAILKRP